MTKVIELVLETDETGALHIPAELLGKPKPLTRMKLKVEAEEPTEETQPQWGPQWGPLWAKMTPEERAKDLLTWLESFEDGPGLSDWAVSRDSIYD
ncbi:hypothetical protein BH24DEI1_BH24DEI1_08470 [soil metagenome]|jgi:hypothetical protein|nr:hypothetical protein [Deinococcota bacterium]